MRINVQTGLDKPLFDVVQQLQKMQKESPSEERIKDLSVRVADLEVKMAKLWGMMTEKTPYGKEKLTKVGRAFQTVFTGGP